MSGRNIGRWRTLLRIKQGWPRVDFIFWGTCHYHLLNFSSKSNHEGWWDDSESEATSPESVPPLLGLNLWAMTASSFLILLLLNFKCSLFIIENDPSSDENFIHFLPISSYLCCWGPGYGSCCVEFLMLVFLPPQYLDDSPVLPYCSRL